MNLKMQSLFRLSDKRNRLGLSKGAVMVAVIALLVVGSVLLSNVAEGRKSLGQSDYLTPIQREIERQRQRLASADVEARRDALMRLGNLKRPEASRTAAVGLNDPVPVVRVTAAHAVSSLPPHEVASLVAPLLKDKAEFVRREAAHVLGKAKAREAVAALVDTLNQDKQPSVRNAAAVALGQIGDESAVQALAQVLSNPSQNKKKKANPANEFLLRSAARSLGQIRSRAAVPALITALENEHNVSDVRREAAIALGLIADPSALPALQAVYSTAEDPYLSEAARMALRRIARVKN